MTKTGRPKKATKDKKVKPVKGWFTVLEKKEVSEYAVSLGKDESDIVREAVLGFVREKKNK
jgi:hypothetical protein